MRVGGGQRLRQARRAQFSSILGRLGFKALWERSGKLAQRSSLPGSSPVDDAAELRASLEGLDAAGATEAAASLFATFFALITTFIGDRLTTQALRSAWPATIGRSGPPETQS